MTENKTLEEKIINYLVVDRTITTLINNIAKRMNYKFKDQEQERIWAGEYCGRCGAKSRSYEGGKCKCDREIKILKKELTEMMDKFYDEVYKENSKFIDDKSKELLKKVVDKNSKN